MDEYKVATLAIGDRKVKGKAKFTYKKSDLTERFNPANPVFDFFMGEFSALLEEFGLEYDQNSQSCRILDSNTENRSKQVDSESNSERKTIVQQIIGDEQVIFTVFLSDGVQIDIPVTVENSSSNDGLSITVKFSKTTPYTRGN